MHKVVFNNCYGGFSISLKAIDWLEHNSKDEALLAHIKECKLAHIKECKENNKYSVSGFPKQMLCYNVSEYFEDNRHHKDLVAVVEALGKDANGDCAALAIKKINSNQYRIDEYDGAEEVIVPDCENWIFINGD